MANEDWKLFQYSLFKKQYDDLLKAAEKIKAKQPEKFAQHPKVKLLAKITELIDEEIPNDPASSKYNLGNTLGPQHRHWKRAKFGRYRLFFRYSSDLKIIVYAWVNDERSLRKAGDKNDPYELFKKAITKGEPPSSIEDLLAGSEEIDED